LLPRDWTDKVLNIIKGNPQHRFYLLTKQPQNLIKWSPFPENCFVGVTATNADMAFDAINCLDDVQANVRFLSFEPLLKPINLVQLDVHLKNNIDWLIIGACTGTYNEMQMLRQRKGYPDLQIMPPGKLWTAQPKIEWLREIVEAADKAGIPVFLKDNLKPLFKPDYEVEYPWAYKWGAFRQEMPTK